jgi:hypothetical protein
MIKSGYLGKPIAALLGMVNSSLTMPINLDHHFRHSEHIKELRLCGPTSTISLKKIKLGWISVSTLKMTSLSKTI